MVQILDAPGSKLKLVVHYPMLKSRDVAKAKTSDSQARLFIADKKEAIFIVSPENAEEEMGIWLNSPYFTDSIASILESSLKLNSINAK